MRRKQGGSASRPAAIVAVVTAMTACGGGGGGDDGDAPSTPEVRPGALQLEDRALSIRESDGIVSITVTRSGGSDGAVSAVVETSGGTARSGEDLIGVSTTVSFADGDSAAQSVDIAILDDTDPEPVESFTVTLSSPTGGATLGAGTSATITIEDGDVAAPAALRGNALNDTGVTTCSNAVSNGLACNDVVAGTDEYPGQDAEHGRDVTDDAGADGPAGFSFTKLDASGAPLPDQSLSFSVGPWDCVRDEVTGLTWEMKTDDDGLRDRDWTYSWYNSTGIDDGGDEGAPARGTCFDLSGCDTEKYVAAVNDAGICGRADWRLPTRAELLSLVDHGAGGPALAVDDYFPDLGVLAYWSSSSAGDEAFNVDFTAGEVAIGSKNDRQAVRVVSGAGAL